MSFSTRYFWSWGRSLWPSCMSFIMPQLHHCLLFSWMEKCLRLGSLSPPTFWFTLWCTIITMQLQKALNYGGRNTSQQCKSFNSSSISSYFISPCTSITPIRISPDFRTLAIALAANQQRSFVAFFSQVICCSSRIFICAHTTKNLPLRRKQIELVRP